MESTSASLEPETRDEARSFLGVDRYGLGTGGLQWRSGA
jgi:hypothetical protein